MLGVVADGVLDDGGEGELSVRIGSGYFNAVEGLGYSVGANEVGFVLVGEGESVDAGDGVNRLGKAAVEDGRSGKSGGVDVSS